MKKGCFVWSFFDKLMNLITKYNPTTSGDTIKDWFINRLPPNCMYRYMVRSGASTLEEAQKEAQMLADSAPTYPKSVQKVLKKDKRSKKHCKYSSSSNEENNDSDSSSETSDSSKSSTSSS